MSYATVETVKLLGGLNEDQDYNLFRFTTPDELDAAISRLIDSSSAIISEGNPSDYAGPTTGQAARLLLGESYYTLFLLLLPLKSRKVTGTHWALDQEDSARFQELIDTEYKGMAQEMLPDFIIIETGTFTFARPTFQIGPVIDPSSDMTLEPEEVVLAEIAQEARGWPIVPVVPAP